MGFPYKKLFIILEKKHFKSLFSIKKIILITDIFFIQKWFLVFITVIDKITESRELFVETNIRLKEI